MKQIVVKFLIVVGITYTLSALVLFIINTGLHHSSKDAYGIINTILYTEDKHDVVIFGASIAKNNINPEKIEEVCELTSFNFGIWASNLVESKTLCELLLSSKHPKPKHIITVLSHHDFKEAGVRYPPNYIPYMDEKPIHDNLLPLMECAEYGRYVPFFFLAEYTDNLKVNGFRSLFSDEEIPFKGFQPLLTQRRMKIEKSGRFGKVEVDTTALSLLKDFAKLVTDNQIEFHIVLTPVFKSSGDGYSDQFYSIISSIIEQNDKAYFWDFHSDPISEDRSNFYDKFHLQKKGADILTEKLMEKILAAN